MFAVRTVLCLWFKWAIWLISYKVTSLSPRQSRDYAFSSSNAANKSYIGILIMWIHKQWYLKHNNLKQTWTMHCNRIHAQLHVLQSIFFSSCLSSPFLYFWSRQSSWFVAVCRTNTDEYDAIHAMFGLMMMMMMMMMMIMMMMMMMMFMINIVTFCKRLMDFHLSSNNKSVWTLQIWVVKSLSLIKTISSYPYGNGIWNDQVIIKQSLIYKLWWTLNS